MYKPAVLKQVPAHPLNPGGQAVGTECCSLRPTLSQGDRQAGSLQGLWPCGTCLPLTPALGL